MVSSTEQLTANGKERLRQFLSHDPPGNPFCLDDIENVVDESNFPIPSNYWARGMLVELFAYKKFYKKLGLKHFPNAAAYDYATESLNKLVQVKSVKTPSSPEVLARMKKAIHALQNAGPNAEKTLHIFTKNADGAGLKQLLIEYATEERITIEIIVDQFTFP